MSDGRGLNAAAAERRRTLESEGSTHSDGCCCGWASAAPSNGAVVCRPSATPRSLPLLSSNRQLEKGSTSQLRTAWASGWSRSGSLACTLSSAACSRPSCSARPPEASSPPQRRSAEMSPLESRCSREEPPPPLPAVGESGGVAGAAMPRVSKSQCLS